MAGANVRTSSRAHGNHSPESVSIASARSPESQTEPVADRPRFVVQEERRAVAVDDERIHAPIIVVIADGKPASDYRRKAHKTATGAHVLKLTNDEGSQARHWSESLEGRTTNARPALHSSLVVGR